MKKQLLTLALAAAGLTAANQSFANKTFYACAGQSFTLHADNPGTPAVYTEFEWYNWDGVNAPVLQTTTTQDYIPSWTLASATTAEKFTYIVKGVDATCTSEPDTITVFVLPSLTTDINAPSLVNCSNGSTDLTATSNFASLDFSSITTGTVDILDFVWTGGGTSSGAKNSINTVTAAGSYSVSVGYDMTGLSPNDGYKACDAATNSSSVTISISTAPTAPVVTIQ